MPATESKNDDAQSSNADFDFGDAIDMNTFEQILEMDEGDDDREFSSSIVFGFFEQAEETFESMDSALDEKDLDQLASLGHFLKGSSATLGLVKVREACAQIEHYGKRESEEGTEKPDDDQCLERIVETIKTLKSHYADAETHLKKFYKVD